MTFERSLQLFDVAVLALNLAGICLVAHFALSMALRTRIRTGEPLFAEVFGSPIWGDLAGSPWLMRARFFWPWASSPSAVASCSIATRALFWAARIAGAGVLAGFVWFLATVVYIGIQRAGMSS